MDIEYLLLLQNFREATGNVLTPFMIWLSDFTHGGLLLVPMFVYWCISKRGGMFLMLSTAVSNFLGEILKMTFCVYRPFVKDARVIPAVHKPSSYSFPSGHTVTAASIFGGLAVLSRKKSRLFSRLCVVMIFLVMFARNYLGVHTPQDVITGLVVSVAVLCAVSVMMLHHERENLFMLLGIVAVIAGVAYVSLKSYPMDADANGKLIVNAVGKIGDLYLYGGSIAGMIAGRLIERRYVRFRESGFNVRGVIVSCVGLWLYYALYFTVRNDIISFLTPIITEWGGTFTHGFVSAFFAVAVWPIVIKLTCRRD
ncbi:MAG: phosphatase PAP2 family protein [Synergistaceae bacterium]|nr:phosphatase PAP2 family protein [Synergistaceae bacterium]